MLGNLGVEVTTLGNHEFDYRAKGLANMMNHAVESGDVLPEMVISNVDWDAMNAAGLTEDQQMLYDAFENLGVKEYVVLEKGDVKVAVTGVFGKDCLACVVAPPLVFEDTDGDGIGNVPAKYGTLEGRKVVKKIKKRKVRK